MEFTVQVKVSQKSLPFHNGEGQHSGPNGAHAAATLAPPLERAVHGMYLLEVRMHTRLTEAGVRLLHDLAATDADSVRLSLMALSAVPVAYNRHRWAVLGDMDEIGGYDSSDYQSLGRFCAEHYIDRLVCVGSMAMHYAAGAIEQGLEDEQVHTFRTPVQASHFLRDIVQAGDVVLIKGDDSMEEIHDGMCAD